MIIAGCILPSWPVSRSPSNLAGKMNFLFHGYGIFVPWELNTWTCRSQGSAPALCMAHHTWQLGWWSIWVNYDDVRWCHPKWIQKVVQIQNPNPIFFGQKSWLEVIVVHPDWLYNAGGGHPLLICCLHDYWKHFLSSCHWSHAETLGFIWAAVKISDGFIMIYSSEEGTKWIQAMHGTLWNDRAPPKKARTFTCITSCDCAPGAVLLRVITAKVAEAIHCFWRFLANFAHRYDSIDSRPICHKSVPPRKKAHLQLPTPADMAPKLLFNMTKKQQRSKHVLPTKGDLSFTILYQTLGISKVAIVIDFDGALFGITVCCFSPIPWGMLDVCVCSVMSWIICVAWAVCVCNIILGRLWVYDITYNINLSYVMFIIHYNTLSLFFIRFQSWPMRSCHSGRKNVPTCFFFEAMAYVCWCGQMGHG